jgi:hypothetical protein
MGPGNAFFFLCAFSALSGVYSDPETVDGMYLEKKSGVLNRQKGPTVTTPNYNLKAVPADFKQGYVGRAKHSKAFESILGEHHLNSKQQPAARWLHHKQQPEGYAFLHGQQQLGKQLPEQKGVFWNHPSTQVASPQWQKQLQAPEPPRALPQIERPTSGAEPNLIKDSIKEEKESTTSAIRELNQLNPSLPAQEKEEGRQEASSVSSADISSATQRAPQKKDSVDDSASSIVPVAGFLKGIHSEPGESAGVFSGDDRHKAILGLIIGVAFVAVFVAMGIGLAAQCVAERVRQNRSAVFSNVRTPNEEDRTPPELRGNGAPSFVQPKNGDLKGRSGDAKGGYRNGGQPFFNGKLILRDAPGFSSSSLSSGRRSSNGSTSMTSTLFAAHTAVIMPSPAEQVTDDLVSPKYDTEEDDASEDGSSDDTVYECPGLAAPGEMVVANPFFLQGADMAHLHRGGGGGAEPQPISNQSSLLFHHGIKGVN